MASATADRLDRRKHRGPFRFLYIDLKSLIRRYFGRT
jgi:hypothetical protein